MNPSSFANQLSKATSIINLAARVLKENGHGGGLVADGGGSVIGADGTGADVDLDVSGMTYHRLGVMHTLAADGDAYAMPNNTVYQVGEAGTAGFPTFGDMTNGGVLGERLRCSVVVSSDDDNLTPAYVLVCGAIGGEYPTTAEIEAAVEHPNCHEIDRVSLTRTADAVITCSPDHGNRVDFMADALMPLDLTSV